MKRHSFFLGALACVAVAGLSGCQRNIVRAAPPSVAVTPAPPPTPQPEPEPTVVPPPDEAAGTAPLEPLPALGAPEPTAPRPRPAPVEPAKPKEPEAPQISPQLSPAQLSDAQRRTTSDISDAERNLQLASGRALNASQKDLAEKVRGFLEQAHMAIRASDWVRALNLAQKAQVLSTELTKSL